MQTKSTTRKTFTDAEKQAYREAQSAQATELLKTAALDLLTSDGWQRWALLRSRLHRYSFHNTMLILAQMPDASIVASYRFWKDETERGVKQGERALRVFAPLMRKPTADEVAAGADPEQKRVVAFKLVPVFDVSQTEGPELPIPDSEPVTGDSHATYLPRLEKLAVQLGYTITHEDLSAMHAGGYCDAKRKRIVIDTGQATNAQVRVLIHELAHALGVGYREYGREAAEVIVETATFIVCHVIGLDTAAASVPYVASWGEQDQLKAIETFASVVDKVARQIENAVAA